MERSIGMLIFQAVWYSVEAARDPPTPSLSSVTQIFGPHGEHKTLGQAIPRMGCIPNAIRAAAATCCCHWVRRFPKWPEDLVPLAEWLFFVVVAWNHIFDRLNSCRMNGNEGHFHRAPVCDSIVVVCCSRWTIFWRKKKRFRFAWIQASFELGCRHSRTTGQSALTSRRVPSGGFLKSLLGVK